MKELIQQDFKLLCKNTKNRFLFVLWITFIITYVVSNTSKYNDFIKNQIFEEKDIEQSRKVQIDQVYNDDVYESFSKDQKKEIESSWNWYYDGQIAKSYAFRDGDNSELLKAAMNEFQSTDQLNKAYDFYNLNTFDKSIIDSEFKWREYVNTYYSKLTESSNELWAYNRMLGFNFLYRIFEDVIPIASILLIILFVVDSVAGEKDSGSIKIKLLLPVSRIKLIGSKIASAAIYNILFLLAPVIFIFLLLGMINGFGSPSFFVLSDSYGATTMNAIEGKIEDVNDKTIVGTPLKTLDMHMSGSYCVGISRFLVPNDFDPNTDVNKPSPDERLTFMSIWKFLSFCILYQLLVILFGTLLGILISTVTTRKGVAIAFGILMGMFLTLIHVDKGILRYIHAGTYMNPVRMLGGTARVTTLNGVTVLSLYTIVISLFIVWITKRQDISC